MQEKENPTESKFKEWLDKHNIPYFYIHQAIDTFSPALKKSFKTKRPDFMILVPHVGFIIVDVEYKKPAEKYEDFQINENETKQYCNLQNYFNLQVWYVFSNETDHYNTWHWIPASKVLEWGECYMKPRNQSYRAVPINKFVQVSMNDSLGRLFAEMSKFY